METNSLMSLKPIKLPSLLTNKMFVENITFKVLFESIYIKKTCFCDSSKILFCYLKSRKLNLKYTILQKLPQMPTIISKWISDAGNIF